MINLARFGLSRPPFAPAADLRSWVSLPAHEAAVAAISAAHTGGAGLALLDGGPGCGKTLAAMRFVADLPAGSPCVVLPAAKFARPADLFQAVLFDLGAEYRGLSETELRLAVADRLLAALAGGGPAVLVLDEAQHLTDEVLEELRLLGNLAGRGASAVFALLVGTPAVRERVSASPLLADRLTTRPRIDPLSEGDAVKLVRGRLDAAGGHGDELIDDEAAGLLAAHTRGSARLLLHAAAAALALAAEAGADAIDAEAALEGLARAGLAVPEPEVLPLPAKPPAARRTRKRKSA